MALHAGCWAAAVSAQSTRGQMGTKERRLMKQAASTVEKFDAAAELAAKAAQAAELLQAAAGSAIAFTGAGISTAAGLGDYRGKQGKWTLESWGLGTDDSEYTTEYEALRPTYSHEAVAELVRRGTLCYVVSQNADGLHALSGIPSAQLSDVHGSAFTEYCRDGCSARYVRDCYCPEDRAEAFFAGKLDGPKPPHIQRCRGCGSNHWTGRSCEACGAALHDTMISFGDGLEDCVLGPAFEKAEAAGCCLSLGSTMSIGPSNAVVQMGSGPLVACVRQDTEMDGHVATSGGVRAYGDTDAFMALLMRSLLGDVACEAWEATLEGRKAGYDRLRPTAGKRRGDIFVMKT
jgi:mono-ADP-ribosyltransferase sirtuin 6